MKILGVLGVVLFFGSPSAQAATCAAGQTEKNGQCVCPSGSVMRKGRCFKDGSRVVRDPKSRDGSQSCVGEDCDVAKTIESQQHQSSGQTVNQQNEQEKASQTSTPKSAQTAWGAPASFSVYTKRGSRSYQNNTGILIDGGYAPLVNCDSGGQPVGYTEASCAGDYYAQRGNMESFGLNANGGQIMCDNNVNATADGGSYAVTCSNQFSIGGLYYRSVGDVTSGSAVTPNGGPVSASCNSGDFVVGVVTANCTVNGGSSFNGVAGYSTSGSTTQLYCGHENNTSNWASGGLKIACAPAALVPRLYTRSSGTGFMAESGSPLVSCDTGDTMISTITADCRSSMTQGLLEGTYFNGSQMVLGCDNGVGGGYDGGIVSVSCLKP